MKYTTIASATMSRYLVGITVVALGVFVAAAQKEDKPILRFGTPSDRLIIRTLTWDTERGDRTEQNLLRGQVGLHLEVEDEDGTKTNAMAGTLEPLGVHKQTGTTTYSMPPNHRIPIHAPV